MQDDGTCVCDGGWKSPSCEQEGCPYNCHHDLGWGTCVDLDHCEVCLCVRCRI